MKSKIVSAIQSSSSSSAILPAHVQQLQNALSKKNERNQRSQFSGNEGLYNNKVKTQLEAYEQVLIRRNEVERLTALSRSRIYALMAAGDFPKPVNLGAMSVAWVLSEVLSWVEVRIFERNASGV